MSIESIVPTLETARLRLRPFSLKDADRYGERIFSDPDVMRYMNVDGTVPPNPKMHAMGYIIERNREWRLRGHGAWALVEKATDELIGHTGLFVIERTEVVEVGYALGKAFWGKGYATEAARETLRYGFEVLKLAEIVAVAFPANAASLRVMEKIGMRSLGITDTYYNLDLACYTLTRSEFLSRAHKNLPPDGREI